ncbi:LysM peptidoglycan-binding domain-containing protein [Chengkuizengella sp. SCS-71B]|uniref:LysM peptidoglycan-binding domain-containing protein n=1 Tax=Chengkuizengella sp. SCS-71B TaxID=3115290 RepID=UPI0032C2106B
MSTLVSSHELYQGGMSMLNKHHKLMKKMYRLVDTIENNQQKLISAKGKHTEIIKQKFYQTYNVTSIPIPEAHSSRSRRGNESMLANPVTLKGNQVETSADFFTTVSDVWTSPSNPIPNVQKYSSYLVDLYKGSLEHMEKLNEGLKLNAKFASALDIAKKASKRLAIVGHIINGVNFFTSDNKWKEGLKIGGSYAGAFLLGAIGTMIGGPIGGAIGSMIGLELGTFAGEKLYDFLSTSSKKTVKATHDLISTTNSHQPSNLAKSMYTIQKGDTLWDLAGKYLGDPMRWPTLYEMNKNLVGSNPDLIYPGNQLHLPIENKTNLAIKNITPAKSTQSILSNTWEQFRKWWSKPDNPITNGHKIIDSIVKLYEGVKEDAGKLKALFKKIKVPKGLKNIGTKMSNIKLPKSLGKGLGYVGHVLNAISIATADNKVKETFKVVGGIAGGIFGGTLGSAAGPIGTALGGIAGVGVGSKLGEGLYNLGEWVYNVFSTPNKQQKKQGMSMYTIQKGDTLWDLAGKHLGGPMKWPAIYEMNKDLVGSNPDLIYPGNQLRLPTASSTVNSVENFNHSSISTQVWTELKSTAVNSWNEMKLTSIQIWNEIKGTMINAWDELKSSIANTWNELKTSTAQVWSELKSTAANSWNEIKLTTIQTWNEIKGTVTSAWDELKSTSSYIWNGATETVADMWKGLGDVATSIEGSASSAYATGKKFIDRSVEYIAPGMVDDPHSNPSEAIHQEFHINIHYTGSSENKEQEVDELVAIMVNKLKEAKMSFA